MEELKVYKQWLCDENNQIVDKPLSFWFEYFGIVRVENKNYMWLSTKTNSYMDIILSNGNGMSHEQYEECKDKLFFCCNADLRTPDLKECFF